MRNGCWTTRAFSARGAPVGVDHVGIQVDGPTELSELAGRLKVAGEPTFDQEATTCCYALSDKSWVTDPAGVRWETFFTFGEATAYGEDPAGETAPAGCRAATPGVAASSCC
jgi:hypothetical protein